MRFTCADTALRHKLSDKIFLATRFRLLHSGHAADQPSQEINLDILLRRVCLNG